MNLKKVRVGVVGVGNLGQHHARIYSELPRAELVGVVDIDEARAKQIAYRHNTTPYIYYKDLFGKVDAVSIVVPTTLHYKIARDFIEKGVNVLVEKPVTYTLEEARELIRAAHANDVTLQVGHIERFNNAFLALKSVIKKPIYIESHRLGPFNPRVMDVGVVLDLMIHDIDIITSIVGADIEAIEAFGSSVFTDKEDIASAQMLFSNGVISTIVASRVSGQKVRRLDVIEKDRSISLDYIKQELYIYAHSPGKGNGKNGSLVERIEIEWQEPLRLELEHFLSCIDNGERPIVGIEEGINALEVAFKILERIEYNSNSLISLPPYAPYSEEFKEFHHKY